jgi:hypothetical protein
MAEGLHVMSRRLLQLMNKSISGEGSWVEILMEKTLE